MHHLQPAIVNDQVFPNVATGFGDTLPAMREQTVKVIPFHQILKNCCTVAAD